MKAPIAAAIVSLALACTPGTRAPEVSAPQPIVDLPQLAYAEPAAVERTLGKPTSITPITNAPQNMPGEYRHYAVTQKHGPAGDLQVRYYKGVAISFVLTVPPTLLQSRPEFVANLGGLAIETNGNGDSTWREWSGSFAGIQFDDIRVTGNGRTFDHLAARVRYPPS